MFKTGRYEIVGELGRGSMGVVYEGFDPLINRRVAIKTMRVEGLSPREYEQYKARFQAEAQAAGVLEHPNIVTIHDFGEDNSILYLAMEFLKGRSLRDIIDEKGVLPVETIIPVFQQVSSALDHAHAHHIIHRDVKPANIMVLDSGLVKVTDFGIAKVLSTETGMTYAGQILGTPNYMSPEQVKGDRIDGRSDIFALGVILYELITGQKPFGGQNVTTVMYKIINEQPTSPLEVDPLIHPGLTRVIGRALAKRPEDRYPTCRELADDLTNYKNLVKVADAGETVVTQRPPLLDGQRQAGATVRPRRFPVLWAALASLVVLAGVLGGYYFRAGRISAPAAASSQTAGSQTVTPATLPLVTSTPDSSVPKADSGSAGGAVTVTANGAPAAANAPPVSQTEAVARKAPPISAPVKSQPANKPDAASKGAPIERESRPAPSKGSREPAASASSGGQPGASVVADSAAKQAAPAPTQQIQPSGSAPGPSGGAVTSSASPPADTNAAGSEYVLETDPSGVDVVIDGKVWGRTDKDKPVVASLSAGDHTLVLKYHGVEVLKRQIKKTTDAQWQKWKLPISEPVP